MALRGQKGRWDVTRSLVIRTGAYIFSRFVRAHASEVRRPNRMRDVEGSGTKKTLRWRLVRSVFLMMISERWVLRKESISARVKSGSRSYQKRSASRRR